MATVAKVPGHQRLKNIGKSFGYAFIDVAGQLNPTLYRMARETKNAATEASMTIRSINNGDISQAVKDFLDPNGDNAINNIINDFKTGKWYNKERMDNAGFEDMDFDIDEDWGDDDFSTGSDEGGSSSEATASSMISGMQNLSSDIAISMGRSSAASAEYVAKSSHRDTMAVYDLTRAGFNNISGILLNINSKLDAMIEMQTPIVQQAQNTYTFQIRASEFFETTNQTLNRMSASLEQIAANTAVLNADPRIKRDRRAKTLSSLIVGGEFDFGGYFEMMKANAKEQADMIKSFASMGSMVGGKNLKNLSPMAMAMTAAISHMVPVALKESMKDFNTVLEGAVPAFLKVLKKQSKKGGFLTELLGDIFLPDLKGKSKISKSNYNKGPVAWDGIARKSVVEVIPTYLAKIYGALGGEELYYDFENGRFTSTSAIAKDFRKRRFKEAREAAGDFGTRAFNGKSDKEKAEMMMFFMNAIENGDDLGDLRRNGRKKKEYYEYLKNMGLSTKSKNALLAAMDNASSKELMKLSIAMSAAQSRMTDRYNREEQAGHSNLNYLDNGFGVSKNHFKMSYSQYIHGIYQMVGNIYAVLGGKSGENVFDIKTGKIKSSKSGSREKSNMDTKGSKNKSGFTIEELIEMLNDKNNQYYGMTAEEIERADKERKVKDQAEKYKSTIRSWIEDKRNKFRKTKFYKKIFGESSSDDDHHNDREPLVSRMCGFIDVLTNGIADLFYGDHGDKGIIDIMKDKISDTFTSITDKFKNWFSDVIGSRVKSFAKGAKDSFMANFRLRDYNTEGMTEAQKQRAIRKLEESKRKAARRNAGQTQEMTNPPSAYGRKVTRTGLVAVSEGELIVPSEFNPYYRGLTNKRSQIRNEQRIVDNFYGAYANGGKPSEFDMKVSKAGQIVGKGAFDGASAVAGGVVHFVQQIMGKIDKDGIEDQRKKVNEGIKNTMSKVLKDMGMNKNAMGVGALAGVGVSILTGAFVGPIAGAAIGAGVGLISRSETLQNMLFGEIGEDGKHSKALGKAVDFVKEKVKAIGTWGKEKFMDKAPSMIGGAGVGLILGGPFGIIGNALLGSAFGYLTTTEKFKEYMFGDGKGNGKASEDSLAGIIRDKIVFNLDDIFHNTKNLVKGLFKDIGKKISSGLKNLGEKIRKRIMTGNGFFSRAARKVGDVTGGAVKGFFGKVIGGPLTLGNQALQRFNLRHGYNLYNRKDKRNMTAAERIAQRETLDKHGTRILDEKWKSGENLDMAINEATDEELFEMQDELMALRDSKYLERRAINDNMEKLYGNLEGIDFAFAKDGHKKKFDNLVRAGKADKALEYLANKGYDSEAIRRLVTNTAADNTDETKIRATINNVIDSLKQKGIDVEGGKNLKAYELIQDEINAKGLTRENPEFMQKDADEQDYRVSQLGILLGIAEAINPRFCPFLVLKGKYKALVNKALRGSGYEVNPHRTTKDAPVESSEHQNTIAETISEITGAETAAPESAAGSRLSRYFSGGASGEDDGKTYTENTFFGPMQYTIGRDGEREYSTNDNESDQSQKRRDEFFNSINELPKIGGVVNSISGLFGSLFTKLFGKKGKDKDDDENGEGLFGGLLNFGGIGGLITKIAAAGGIGAAAKTMLGNAATKAAGTLNKTGGVLGLAQSAFLTAAASGALNDYAAEHSWGSGKGVGSSLYITDEEGNKIPVQYDEDGNLVTIYGDAVDGGTPIGAKGTFNFQQKFWRRYVPHVLKGGGTVTEGTIKSLGRLIKGGGQKGVLFKKARMKIGQKLMDSADIFRNTRRKITNKILQNSKLNKALEKAFGKEASEEVAEKAIKEAAYELGENATEAAIEKTAVNKLEQEVAQNIASESAEKIAKEGTEEGGEALGTAFMKAASRRTQKEAVSEVAETATEKGLTSVASAAMKTAKKVSINTAEEALEEAAASGGMRKMMKELAENLVGLFKRILKCFGGWIPDGVKEVFAKGSKEIAEEFAEATAEQAAKKAGKKAAGAASNSGVKQVPLVGWAWAIIDAALEFEGGWNRADRDFGVNEATTTERAISGLIDAAISLIGAIPAIGVVLGTTIEVLGSLLKKPFISIVVKLLSKFGIATDLERRQQESLTEYEADEEQRRQEYEAKGLEYEKKSYDDWNAEKFDHYTWGERVVNWGKGVSETVKNASSGFGKFVVDGTKAIANKAGAFLSDAGDAIGSATKAVVDGAGEILSDVGHAIGDWAGDMAGGFLSLFGGSSGIKQAIGKAGNLNNYFSGGASSFINQMNAANANKPFAGSTFGEKGCGPAVATMAANALGKNLSLNSAVERSAGHQNSVGVDAGYFGDALGKSGISTQYISGADTPRSLAAGNKVILLGHDAKNRSKAKSPFGPGNHYVLATGMRNGKVMINDPENRGPKAYDPSILNNVRLGISAGASKIRNVGRKIHSGFCRLFSGGASIDRTDYVPQIWGFLKSKGFSDIQAAGFMGCWHCESTNNPNRVEADYTGYGQTLEQILAGGPENMNAYCQRIFNNYHERGLSINENAYYNPTDGNYYPGMGLCAWTGPAAYTLIQFANENGLDVKALSTQLDYFWQDYNRRPNLIAEMGAASTLQDAVLAALNRYEYWAGSFGTGSKQYRDRIAAAEAIFNRMQGQQGELPEYSSSSSGFNLRINNQYDAQKLQELQQKVKSLTPPNGAYEAQQLQAAQKELNDFKQSLSGYNAFNTTMFNTPESSSSSTGGWLGTAGSMIGNAASQVSGLSGNAGTKGGLKVEDAKRHSLLSFVSDFSEIWGQALGQFGGKKYSYESGTKGTSGNDASYKGGYIGSTFSTSPSEIMRSILGKISYSMKGPRDPEQGSADCSSTVRWAIKKAGGPDIGGHTGAQYNNENLTPIWHNGGQYAQEIDSAARKDDVLFFARPGGSSDKGAALDHVGHVGLYLGDGEYIDHGGGNGPKIHKFSPGNKLIKISRINGFDPTGGAGLGTALGATIGTGFTGVGTVAAGETIDVNGQQIRINSQADAKKLNELQNRLNSIVAKGIHNDEERIEYQNAKDELDQFKQSLVFTGSYSTKLPTRTRGAGVNSGTSEGKLVTEAYRDPNVDFNTPGYFETQLMQQAEQNKANAYDYAARRQQERFETESRRAEFNSGGASGLFDSVSYNSGKSTSGVAATGSSSPVIPPVINVTGNNSVDQLISYLQALVNNTNPIAEIARAVLKIPDAAKSVFDGNTSGGSSGNTPAANIINIPSSTDDVDPSIVTLATTLAALAKG